MLDHLKVKLRQQYIKYDDNLPCILCPAVSNTETSKVGCGRLRNVAPNTAEPWRVHQPINELKTINWRDKSYHGNVLSVDAKLRTSLSLFRREKLHEQVIMHKMLRVSHVTGAHFSYQAAEASLTISMKILKLSRNRGNYARGFR